MQRADFFAACGRQRFFPYLDDAVNYGAKLHLLLRAGGSQPGVGKLDFGGGTPNAAAADGLELGELGKDGLRGAPVEPAEGGNGQAPPRSPRGSKGTMGLPQEIRPADEAL